MLLRHPSPPPSPSDEGSEYDDEDWQEEPYQEYTEAELIAVVHDFYSTLIRLFVPSTALKIPPSEGWPNITPASTAQWDKSSFVVNLIRYLPYIEFDGDQDAHRVALDQQCYCQDYSTYDADDFAEEEFGDMDCTEENTDTAKKHWIVLARGTGGSGGLYLVYNTETGETHEEVVRYQGRPTGDVMEYFAKWKRKYENLDIVPIPGSSPGIRDLGEKEQEAEDEEEEKNRLERDRKEEEDMVEPEMIQEDGLATEQDMKWVRKIYHDYGWPGQSYDKAAALEKISDYTERRRMAEREADLKADALKRFDRYIKAAQG